MQVIKNDCVILNRQISHKLKINFEKIFKMTKKQRNRKDVAQNKRNRMINRRYSSTIKSLTKLLNTKITISQTNLNEEDKLKINTEIKNIQNNFYSIIDKAVKKRVIHKNNAARKKSNVHKLSKVVNVK